MIDVYIADDHTMLVEGLTAAINSSENARVSHTFLTLADCRKRLASKQPDVLLLDISMPDGSGVEFCGEVVATYPLVKIIAITSHNEYSIARQMLDNGAQGYILKNSSSEELIEGIESVCRGKRYICDEINSIIKHGSANEVYLSPREKNILKLIVEGCTNSEIAERIFLSADTVSWYRKKLLVKLGVKNTASLVKLVVTERLV